MEEEKKEFTMKGLYMSGWKIILSGIIILITGVYIFLKTVYGSDINTLSVFIIAFGFYIIISTLIKFNNFLKMNIEN
jgi:uncharacterized membrane protein HdeD (DUF308 family)